MTTYDFRADADALRAELAKPLAEDALVETVAKALYLVLDGPFTTPWDEIPELDGGQGSHTSREYVRKLATAAIAAVRAHDAGMPCGHCDPGSDEVRCACEIEEADHARAATQQPHHAAQPARPEYGEGDGL